jgi:hypothetical protein
MQTVDTATLTRLFEEDLRGHPGCAGVVSVAIYAHAEGGGWSINAVNPGDAQYPELAHGLSAAVEAIGSKYRLS